MTGSSATWELSSEGTAEKDKQAQPQGFSDFFSMFCLFLLDICEIFFPQLLFLILYFKSVLKDGSCAWKHLILFLLNSLMWNIFSFFFPFSFLCILNVPNIILNILYGLSYLMFTQPYEAVIVTIFVIITIFPILQKKKIGSERLDA